MTAFPAWHPMLVHFPLALILTAATALAAARVVPNPRLAATLATLGTWNLCLGAVAVLFALGTGLGALVHLHLAADARAAVGLHFKWAFGTALLAVLLAVWRGAGQPPDSRPSWLFLVLLVAAGGCLIETGYRGGINVYHYGVGVGE